jgi:hypothetical protein
MDNVIPLPDDFILPSTRAMTDPRLTAELEAWCTSELKAGHTIRFACILSRIDYERAFEMTFDNVNDALMFKMRWM